MKPVTQLKRWTRRTIIRSLQGLGYDFDKISLEGALGRCRDRGVHEVGAVIDIGASNGQWTEKCLPFYPNAHYHLIEAQAIHEPALKALSAARANVNYVLAAAGAREGEIHFDASHPFGGLASETPFPENSITVPVTTVDAQVKAHNLKGPFLLKLDTHGYEIPIFDGAAATLAQTALIVVEVYNFTVSPGSLKFHEMCAYLGDRGFRPVDLCDPLHRPRDRALWQFDLFFAPADNPLFASDDYF